MAIEIDRNKPIANRRVGVRKNKPQQASVRGPYSRNSLNVYTERAMREYGTEVVEQRAVPDFRDGLKPVQRAILWAMYKLGLHHNGAYKKSARTVGDVIGQYHPHGDASTYGAMINLVNAPVQLVQGSGAWGNFRDTAAAYRYTEARLSKFADMMLLDSNYLAVTKMVPNFSQDREQPIVLPAKLPVMLLNGSISIAFGVAANCPPFHPKGVTTLVRHALRGRKITPQLCAKYLQFNYKYGGVCVSPVKDLLPFYETGTGSVQFMPDYTVDDSSRTITMTSVCPGGLTSESGLRTFMTKCADLESVRDVIDETDKRGLRIVVQAAPRLDQEKFDALVVQVEALMLKTERFNLGVTERKEDGTALFRRETIGSIIEQWCRWRIDLEIRVINLLISREQSALDRQKLLLYAVDNLDAIFKALRSKNPLEYLMRTLNIDADKANAILDLKVRQLSRLERSSIVANITKISNTIKGLHVELKTPNMRVDKDLVSIMSQV